MRGHFIDRFCCGTFQSQCFHQKPRENPKRLWKGADSKRIRGRKLCRRARYQEIAREQIVTKQNIEGSEHTVAGRDVNLTSVYPDTPAREIKRQFSKVNDEVQRLFGKVSITTSDETTFDCDKLFASLVNIGIPSNVCLTISTNIVPYIREVVENDGQAFSTAHIRRAVSHAILHMTELELGRSQRQELAAKYARNYGNPKHINMIVFEDGRTQPITYRYLLDSFIPTLLGRVLGRNLKLSTFVSRNNVEHMASEILECIRRLGIYHVRYETILALAEDLATQLPHPWIINTKNRVLTFEHDAERITNHFAVLNSEGCTETEFWRSAYECFNHICSALLCHYSTPMGGGTHAPSNTLRNITRLAALGEHQNLALWDFCSISELEPDLDEQGSSINEFHQRIKLLQRAIDRCKIDRMDHVVNELNWLCEILRGITGRDR